MKNSPKNRGQTLLVPLIFIYSMTATILMVAHFVAERQKALLTLRQVEGQLHNAHHNHIKGTREWNAVVDEPSKDPIPLSNRKTNRRLNHIFIEF